MEGFERMTQWINDGEVRYAIPRMDLRNCGHEKCTARLAEYEDIGMPPEQLMEAASYRRPMEVADAELIRKDNYRDGSNLPRYDWWCPKCQTEFFSVALRYCPHCGQCLQWKEKEDG